VKASYPRPSLLAVLLAALPSLAGLTQDLRDQHTALGITAIHEQLRAAGSEPGAGLRVAVIDTRFCLKHRSLAHLQAGGIVDQWDFPAGTAQAWDTLPRTSHASATLGLLASRWDSLPGILPAAQWLLYHVEVEATETPAEEAWLAQAIDRAVDSGASVISISLGYRYSFSDGSADFPWSTLNGTAHSASQAATRAARRGSVVLVAMSNDYDSLGGAPSLGVPADAPEILSVGAVADDGDPCAFSSMGPTYDGRTKPELVGFGCPVPLVDASSDSGILANNGTSFATPLLAGAVGLVRQLHPDWTPAQVIAALKASADRQDSVDNKRGWGRPDLRKLPASIGIRTSQPISHGFRLLPDGRLLAAAPLGAGMLEVRNLSGQILSNIATPPLRSGETLRLPSFPHGSALVVRLRQGNAWQTQTAVLP